MHAGASPAILCTGCLSAVDLAGTDSYCTMHQPCYGCWGNCNRPAAAGCWLAAVLLLLLRSHCIRPAPAPRAAGPHIGLHGTKSPDQCLCEGCACASLAPRLRPNGPLLPGLWQKR
eukprot:COSAG01_NODE_34_length_34978_cov_45.798475_4_plen_116_part_00